MKKVMIFVLLVGMFLLGVSFASAEDISSCRSLSADTTYDVTEDLYAALDSNCISASGDNTILDCHDFTIRGNESNTASNKFGIYLTGSNATVRNCVFENWSATNNHAAFVSGAESKFYNITVKSDSPSLRFHTGSDGAFLSNITFEGASQLYLYGTASNIEINNLIGGLFTTSTTDNLTINGWNDTILSNFEIYATNSYFNNLDFSDSSGLIRIYGNGTTINNSYFFNVSSRIQIEANNTKFLNSQMINSTGRIYVTANKYGFEFDNMTMNNVTGETFSLGLDSPKNLTIKNSNFIDVVKIYIFKDSGDTNLYNFNFSNNQFNSTIFGYTDIDISYPNYDAVYDSNTFYNIDFVNSQSYNSSYTNNNFYNSSLTLRSANNTNFSNNNLYTSYFRSGYSNDEKSYNVNVFNNYVEGHLIYHTLDLFKTSGFKVYNNTDNQSWYFISTDNSEHGLIYNNTGNSTVSSGHGIMITKDSYNISVYNNTMDEFDFAYLFEWGSHDNVMYDNIMLNGGVFYSLHDTYNNVAYNNYIDGDLILHDNVTNEYFYNNTVTGDLIFRWDLALGPEGTGAFNNTIQDTSIGGNLILQDNSTDNILINVTWAGIESVSSVNASSYNMKWYLDSSSNINNTNITLINSSGDVVYSNLINGSIARQTLIDYENLGGTQTNYSNYTISASASGYATNTTGINLTSNTDISFTLIENVAPIVIVNSPSTATSTTGSISLNVTLNENGTCEYSFDAGTTNSSMTTTDNLTFTASVTKGNGAYVLNYYCNDSIGNLNDTVNVSFSVAIPVTDTSSGGSINFYPSASDMAEGYSRSLRRGGRLKFEIGGDDHELKVDKIENETVTIIILSEPQNKTLSVGEEWKVNLDNDTDYDLLVRLDDVSVYRAEIFVQEISELVAVEVGEEVVVEDVVEDVVDVDEGGYVVWVVVTVLILIVVLVLLWFKFGKNVFRKIRKKKGK